jgi:HME family heavy-metal exporter/cobalt-zinc-cadmium resistance protein CzcA
MDEGDLIVQLQKAPSISLTASLDMDQRVQQALLEGVPEIRSIVARTGSTIWGWIPWASTRPTPFLCSSHVLSGVAARKILQMPSAA